MGMGNFERERQTIVKYTDTVHLSEAIKVPFGWWSQMGPRNYVLDGGQDPPMGMGNFGG